jgi:uncharacterized membrane-anchored protein
MRRWTGIAIAACAVGLWTPTATRAQETPDASFAEGAAASDAMGATAEGSEPTEAETLGAEERATYERLVALDASFTYQTGGVTLADGLATLTLPESLRFMDPASTERLLVEGWGNPDGAGTLGMIVPAGSSPLSGDSWGVVITYDEEGYVSDEDADSIDYEEMLAEMQASTEAANEARAEQGFEQVELVGWAERPRYEKDTHKLFWAKELAFEGSASNTLNYNVRVLGRRGVLVLNAVASMEQLGLIQTVMPDVIAASEFNEGHRYADYQPGKDKLAAYGLAALVVGGIAAKSGLLTKLLAVVLGAKKILIPAAIALVAGGRRLLGRSKQTERGPTPPPA